MALQNRVTPLGDIVAAAERGTMMGNRGGRIHDAASQDLLKRRFASRQWICCVLAFKNRQRPVMGRGYTELFFFDEVTALAAGHRPCFECRRAEAKAFAAAFAQGNGLPSIPRAPEMDRILHEERLDHGAKRLHPMQDDLPNGAVIVADDGAFARRSGSWLRWRFAGYEHAAPDLSAARLVTPPSIVAALRAGFQPGWHETADGFRSRSTHPTSWRP